MNQVAPIEERIASKIDGTIAGALAVSGKAGGLDFSNAAQAMEFAKMMSVSGIAVPKHLRANPGACLAIVIQAIEWRLSPYAVANKSYSVNDRLAYESQLVQAVILQRAPITGRFKVEFTGQGETRVCRVWADLRDSGEQVEYVSPPFGRITPKNSPLWKSDPDQQHFYYSGRALCRRHFPDVLLGVYARDEMEDEHVGPDRARDVTPARPTSISDKLDALVALPEPARQADHGPDASDGDGADEATTEAPVHMDPAEFNPKLEALIDPLLVAHARGVDAYRDGMSRKAVPPEWRDEAHRPEAVAWLAGHDAARADADADAGG